MARSTMSAILAGGLMLFAGASSTSAGLMNFFHRSNCGCQECCRERECECEQEVKEHCCCFCPPCPPEGLFAYSVVPIELNGVAALPTNPNRSVQPETKKEEETAKEEAAAETKPTCTLEDVCERQDKMDAELVKLDRDLTDLTRSVKELTLKVKGMQSSKNTSGAPSNKKATGASSDKGKNTPVAPPGQK